MFEKLNSTFSLSASYKRRLLLKYSICLSFDGYAIDIKANGSDAVALQRAAAVWAFGLEWNEMNLAAEQQCLFFIKTNNINPNKTVIERKESLIIFLSSVTKFLGIISCDGVEMELIITNWNVVENGIFAILMSVQVHYYFRNQILLSITIGSKSIHFWYGWTNSLMENSIPISSW